MLNYIDKIYLVNLEKRKDRFKKVDEQFKKNNLNYKHILAVDGEYLNDPIPIKGKDYKFWNKYALGLVKTWSNILNDAIENNYYNILIFEDDHLFIENFCNLFNAYFIELPPDWSIVKLSANVFEGEEKITDNIIKVDKSNGTHAVILNNKIFRKLLDFVNREEFPLDNILDLINANMYMFYPGLTYPYPSFSNIVNIDVDYNISNSYIKNIYIEKLLKNERYTKPKYYCKCGFSCRRISYFNNHKQKICKYTKPKLKGSITVIFCNYWTKDLFMYNDKYLFNFIKNVFKNDCNVIELKNGNKCDILISSVFGNIENNENYDAKLKLFFTGENLNRYPPYNDINLLKEKFDLIVGFLPTDEKNKIIRFPLWLTMHPFYEISNDKNNIIDYIKYKKELNKKFKKENFAACLSKHNRMNIRGMICKKLENHGKILYPGKWNKNITIGKSQHDKINLLKTTKFNVCPENSKSIGYCTEKIFHSFEANCVPIYWGYDLPESDIINKNSYIFADINNEENLKKQIINAIDNYDSIINEPIFNNNAKKIINNYYETLRLKILDIFFNKSKCFTPLNI